MKKIILLVFLTLLVLGCKNKQFSKNTDSTTEDTSVISDIVLQISDGGDTNAEWENLNLTREELNDKINLGPMYPFGTYFWNEFSTLKSVYGLDSKESEILGRWYPFDGSILSIDYHTYVFYPNRLLIIKTSIGRFKEEPNKYLHRAVGVWDIKDGKVIAMICFFIVKVINQQGENYYEIIEIVPYTVEIVNLNYIDPVGYSRRLFNFKLLEELEKKIVPYKDTKNKYDFFMVRNIYYLNTFYGYKEYGILEPVPEMAEQGISGMDIMQDQKLFKKYVLDLEP